MPQKTKLNFRDIVPQVRDCAQTMKEAYYFFKKNQLWRGIFEHKWILLITIFISLLFSYNLIASCIDIFSASESVDLDTNENNNLLQNANNIGKKLLLTGGSKYLFLILLEVIIFYFAVKTLSIVKNKVMSPSFKDFVTAEKRMIKVMFRNFIKGAIISIIIKIPLSILNIQFLEDFIMFFVYAYFIGFAFFDNYTEQFKMSIKDSTVVIAEERWASTLLGVVISLLLYVPVIGPLATPFFGAITATLYGHKYELEGTIEMETIE